jgi:hypothetical protein
MYWEAANSMAMLATVNLNTIAEKTFVSACGKQNNKILT